MNKVTSIIVASLLFSINSIPNTSSDSEINANTSNFYTNSTAILETNYGIIKFMLYEEGAPTTTANFIKLASKKFYDGTKFHRVVDDFVIQGGDPNSKDNNPYNDGWGGSGETIPLEINSSLTHEDGAVGMARGEDPNSASSQFYICDGAQHQLDGDYAVFGIVIEGIEVVRKIASAETYGYKRPLLKDHPVEDIVMLRVWVIPGYWTNNSQALDSTSLFLRSVLDLKSIIFFSLLIVGIIAFILYKKLAPIYKRV